MSLLNQNSGMMNGSGEVFFEDQSLKSSIHESLQSETQNVIQLVFTLLI